MTKKPMPRVNASILEEASEWFIDFNEDVVTAAGREEFNRWLRRSPEHVRAFLQISALWEEAGMVRQRPNIHIDDLLARARAEHNVYALELAAGDRITNPASAEDESAKRAPAAVRERASARGRWFAAAASIVVVVAGGAIAWYSEYRGSTYATQVGEQRSITLADGSSVELNSRSRIKVRFTETQRSVDLVEGQALFTVAKDAARPFVVASGDTRVRAVGTQFDVYRKREGTVVTVVEGRVAVASNLTGVRSSGPVSSEAVESERSATREAQERSALHEGRGVPTKLDGPGWRAGEVLLAAGEQLRITAVAIEPAKLANVAAATAWTDKKLIFESTPLREVVEEFNRYNRQQLVIRDPDLYDFHISGVFPSTDPGRIVEFLRQRFGVTMNRSRDEIEIFRRERDETLPDSTVLRLNVFPEAPREDSPVRREDASP
jgi:transmembrane sensor